MSSRREDIEAQGRNLPLTHRAVEMLRSPGPKKARHVFDRYGDALPDLGESAAFEAPSAPEDVQRFHPHTYRHTYGTAAWRCASRCVYYNETKSLISTCPGGEIGRRKGLKIRPRPLDQLRSLLLGVVQLIESVGGF